MTGGIVSRREEFMMKGEEMLIGGVVTTRMEIFLKNIMHKTGSYRKS